MLLTKVKSLHDVDSLSNYRELGFIPVSYDPTILHFFKHNCIDFKVEDKAGRIIWNPILKTTFLPLCFNLEKLGYATY